MLRYDPMHPEHAKFLAPATTQEVPKKAKKAKKSKEIPVEPPPPPAVVENVEVSKEQFYSVSDTLKEALVQPTKFSLRDLFGNKENDKGRNFNDFILICKCLQILYVLVFFA